MDPDGSAVSAFLNFSLSVQTQRRWMLDNIIFGSQALPSDRQAQLSLQSTRLQFLSSASAQRSTCPAVPCNLVHFHELAGET